MMLKSFASTISLHWILLLLSLVAGCQGDATFPNPVFCGLKTNENVTFSSDVTFTDVAPRLIRKFRYIVSKAEELKLLYGENKIEDLSLRRQLDSHSRLVGFPPTTEKKQVQETLLNSFNDNKKIHAFLRLMKRKELATFYKNKISIIANRVNGILRELCALLSTSTPEQDIVQQYDVPEDYKVLTTTQQYSWNYVLLKDLISFYNGSIALFRSYSQQ